MGRMKEPAPQPPAQWRFLGIILLAMLVIVSGGLAIGLQQSVWFDEAYSITLAHQPIGSLIHLTSLDTHPPFYYLGLKAWGSVFGWSEPSLRLSSLLMMSGAVGMIALSVRRLFGMRAALLSLLLLVVSPFIWRYGFEIRMYSAAAFIVASATYVLIRAQEGRKWVWWAVYGLLVALGLYTLYYTVLGWAAHLVWLLLAWRRGAHPQLRHLLRAPWIWAYLGAALLFLPWLPVLTSQFNNGALTPVAQQLTALNMVGLVSFWFFYLPSFSLTGLQSLGLLTLVVLLALVVGRAWQLSAADERLKLLLFGCYVAIPVLLMAMLSLQRPMYLERYGVPFMPAFLALVGYSISRVWTTRPRLGLLTLIVAVLVSCYGLYQLSLEGNYNFQRLDQPVGREVAASVVPRCHDDTVIFSGPYLSIDESYYFAGCSTYFLSTTQTLPTIGGYGLLANSTRYKTTVEGVDGHRTVLYIHYSDDPIAQIGPGYQLINSQSIAKVVIDTYQKQG